MADRIWLVRHGETEWSRTGQHTGWNDLPLTGRGEEEAYAAKALLRDLEFDAVFCSTLQRARRTCELCGYLHRAELLEDLREWNYGDHAGRTLEQIRADYPDWTIWDGPVPNGETLDQVAARARQAILRIETATKGQAVVFAHGHLLRVLTTQWLGLPPRAARHFALATAAVSVLGFENGSPAILRWNAK
jgi:broad specificity phosphatase PhoE